ncbi:MAG: DUF1289 domain-containing protein [Pseudohongiellaceae bacterium]
MASTSDQAAAPVKTPCIGICSTTSLGDNLCRGCKRFAFEVIDWNLYGADEKRAVLLRIDKLVNQIMEPRFVIHSRERLQQGMRQQGVPVHPELSAYGWLHALLKKRHGRITELSPYGAALRPDYAHRPLAGVWEEADGELLRLCEAHQQRYFSAV